MTATKEVEEKHSSILRRVIQWVWVLLNLVVDEFLVPIAGLLEGLKILGCQYYLVGIIIPPMVEIGLTDLPKFGGTPRDNAPEIMRFHEILLQLQN